MPTYIVLAAMKGEFLAKSGNIYDNFLVMGYVESANHLDAVNVFFDEPQFPINWGDVSYLWAESLDDSSSNGHYGELDRVYMENLGHGERL